MHISTRLILGGSQENTILSCEGQADHGHDVSLVYGPIYGPEGSMLERARAHGGIELTETPNLIREIAPRRDSRCLKNLRSIIRHWQPDVVHTHSSKAGILGRFAAWRERVCCVVHTIHGLAFHPYQSALKNAAYIYAERVAAKKCHHIVCVADAMRKQALAAKIGTRDMYTTIYSGMEVDQFINPSTDRTSVRSELGLSKSDFVIGTISRLAELKGHDDLLDALAKPIRDDRSIKLLWVGDGWWHDRLMHRVSELDLKNNIITTGLVPPGAIPKYLQAMDALAHPSYREGLPRAVVQALLCEVPVVAYDVDGTSEVCIEGETGRLVSPDNIDGLREALLWMRDHPDERSHMGTRGRLLCRTRFDARTMVELLERLYESILSKS